MENRIAELKHDRNASRSCPRQFHATRAVFRSVLLLFHLPAEFQRAAGLAGYSETATLRAQVLTSGAVPGGGARRLVLHMGQDWEADGEEAPARQHLGLSNPNFAEAGSPVALLASPPLFPAPLLTWHSLGKRSTREFRLTGSWNAGKKTRGRPQPAPACRVWRYPT